MKSTTLIKSGLGRKFDKLNEGDLVLAFQINRVNEQEKGDQLETNLDWSFDEKATPEQIKSGLGSLLTTIEQIFGEKMVTEMIVHYADETGKLTKLPGGKGLNFKKP